MLLTTLVVLKVPVSTITYQSSRTTFLFVANNVPMCVKSATDSSICILWEI